MINKQFSGNNKIWGIPSPDFPRGYVPGSTCKLVATVVNNDCIQDLATLSWSIITRGVLGWERRSHTLLHHSNDTWRSIFFFSISRCSGLWGLWHVRASEQYLMFEFGFNLYQGCSGVGTALLHLLLVQQPWSLHTFKAILWLAWIAIKTPPHRPFSWYFSFELLSD